MAKDEENNKKPEETSPEAPEATSGVEAPEDIFYTLHFTLVPTRSLPHWTSGRPRRTALSLRLRGGRGSRGAGDPAPTRRTRRRCWRTPR